MDLDERREETRNEKGWAREWMKGIKFPVVQNLTYIDSFHNWTRKEEPSNNGATQEKGGMELIPKSTTEFHCRGGNVILQYQKIVGNIAMDGLHRVYVTPFL